MKILRKTMEYGIMSWKPTYCFFTC